MLEAEPEASKHSVGIPTLGFSLHGGYLCLEHPKDAEVGWLEVHAGSQPSRCTNPLL